MTILFTAAGRSVSLIRCFQRAAAACDVALRVVAVDTEPHHAPACLIADAANAVPASDSPDYAAAVIAICRHYGAALVVPCAIRDVGPLSAAQRLFNEAGAALALCPAVLVDQMLDLWQAQEMAISAGATAPRLVTRGIVATNPDRWRWPLVARPVRQASGTAPRLIRTPGELLLVENDTAMLLHELPRGRRYVVQLLFDRFGAMTAVAACRIIAAAVGEIAVIDTPAPLLRLAERFAALLEGAIGPVYLDLVLQPDGQILVDRMLPMLSDVYPLIDRAGDEMARALIAEAAHLPPQPRHRAEEGVAMLTYTVPLFITEKHLTTRTDASELAEP